MLSSLAQLQKKDANHLLSAVLTRNCSVCLLSVPSLAELVPEVDSALLGITLSSFGQALRRDTVKNAHLLRANARKTSKRKAGMLVLV